MRSVHFWEGGLTFIKNQKYFSSLHPLFYHAFFFCNKSPTFFIRCDLLHNNFKIIEKEWNVVWKINGQQKWCVMWKLRMYLTSLHTAVMFRNSMLCLRGRDAVMHTNIRICTYTCIEKYNPMSGSNWRVVMSVRWYLSSGGKGWNYLIFFVAKVSIKLHELFSKDRFSKSTWQIKVLYFASLVWDRLWRRDSMSDPCWQNTDTSSDTTCKPVLLPPTLPLLSLTATMSNLAQTAVYLLPFIMEVRWE